MLKNILGIAAVKKTKGLFMLLRKALTLLIAILGFTSLPHEGDAMPARIIILRHGEKSSSWKLSPIGSLRAKALGVQYLGNKASQTLFSENAPPAAFLAITLHSLQLAASAASTWKLPVIAYTVIPFIKADGVDETFESQNLRTQQAVQDVMSNPLWNGKTIVMVWEHHHIANKAMEAQYAPQKITLRQLLALDQYNGTVAVPTTWPGYNYDYFWIVTYPDSNQDTNKVPVPTSFAMQLQAFTSPYDTSIPANLWGMPEKPPQNANP